ncbi:putative bifunctional diguanylate cyclase/phosphodiesterase [Kineococcus sp. DHX-1]|uniref:putative bifunctional diguanylate cyclase/phosphodiesterase n=1 Tax=Kineococcus sp. DHX-1 TaxID=3349638 RepID=UPI0036D3DD34
MLPGEHPSSGLERSGAPAERGDVTIIDAVALSSLPAQSATSLWELSVPAWVVPPETTCGQLDARLRAGRADEHSSVVVVDPRSGRVGSVQRLRFERAMSGPYGFGRALLARRSVTAVAEFDGAVLPAAASLGDALAAVFERPEHRRYDDLVLRDGEEWRRLPVTSVLEAAASRMAWHASRDALTGLANRGAFFSHLQHLVLGAAGEEGVRVGVVFIDLDRLKAVNDTLGHDAGDALIRSVARRLRAACRPDDLVARLGGDEFAVACRLLETSPGAAARSLQAVAGRHLDAVRRGDDDLAAGARSTASIGAALSGPLHGEVQVDGLVREADVAMYAAKQAGGDRVGPVQRVDAEAAPDGGLARALEEGQVVLHFQPIVSAVDGRLLSAEALVRWEHPRAGFQGADRVLRAAQEEGLSVELDLHVLDLALAEHARWRGRPGTPDLVNVNVSTATLESPTFDDDLLGLLRRHRVAPEHLRLELPETASLGAVQAAAPRLHRLAQAGVALVVDDMGAGASSLRHLSAFPVQGLKIDRSFVAGMLTRDGDRAVVELLTNLGAGLGLRVTAEGVETAEQAGELRRLGVDGLQGFHIARPAPADVVFARAAAPADGGRVV